MFYAPSIFLTVLCEMTGRWAEMAWSLLAPRIGAIASFLLGAGVGGIVMSRNFTITKGVGAGRHQIVC
jgi:hypothetical protein